MAGAVVALALLGLLHHDAADRRDAQAHHSHVSGWRLDLSRDRFTGHTLCTLRKDHMVYERGVVTFALGRSVDTANATYRLDGGVVHRAGDVAVEAAGLGARFDTANLDNPSNGEVRIPARDLGDAGRIYIRANTRLTHRVFDLTGLIPAIEEAKEQQCDVS